jgi:hypothetical protein
MVARFRDQESDKWYQSQLYGWERGDTHCWESRNGHGWRMCQVYVAPDPGEGWVLLDPDKDKPAEGDECWDSMDRKWRNRFLESNPFHPACFYRRRTTPQYVPYTWDDREELRGRWFRRKVKDTYEHERLAWRFDLVDGYFYVDSTRSDELLNEWVWLDGSPCGKKVV